MLHSPHRCHRSAPVWLWAADNRKSTTQISTKIPPKTLRGKNFKSLRSQNDYCQHLLMTCYLSWRRRADRRSFVSVTLVHQLVIWHNRIAIGITLVWQSAGATVESNQSYTKLLLSQRMSSSISYAVPSGIMKFWGGIYTVRCISSSIIFIFRVPIGSMEKNRQLIAPAHWTLMVPIRSYWS